MLPETLENIDYNAFEGNLLSNVVIPSRVKVIADGAFANNVNLSNVVINGTPEIREGVFDGNLTLSINALDDAGSSCTCDVDPGYSCPKR